MFLVKIYPQNISRQQFILLLFVSYLTKSFYDYFLSISKEANPKGKSFIAVNDHCHTLMFNHLKSMVRVLTGLQYIQSMSTAGEFMLGQYKIGKSIGEGTFGKVRLGIHMPTGQKVAVKTLQKEKIVEQADIERVTRQICILKILRHPNVIQLYEIIETKTDIHLIMEYAEGGELFDYIVKRKRLDEKEAVNFMQQILAGVEYIHKNGIVHRDLKPQNLLLDHNRNIKIVDFGLSNHYKPGEKLKTACGSPCYAAPEMIAGKRYECLGADIWSCGIILYAMLCGYLPFEDPNTSKLYKKIMAGEYETPRILSAESKQILKGILNTNPQARFRINHIRESKWYNQISKNYMPQGIIVGKDSIEVDQRLLKKMQKQGVEAAQAKAFIENNRHNQATALYYLLKVKADRDPSFLAEEKEPQRQRETSRREDSPLIYRPQGKKDYYMPIRTKPNKDTKQNSKNDSMNVSNIISSLVEANRGRIVTGNRYKKDSNFDKLEEFKLFPNKKNSSIYQPRQHTSRDERSVQVHKERTVEKQRSVDKSQPKNNLVGYHNQVREDGLNKKRQELSDQLKQISFKIDQEINELRKQNNVAGGGGSTNSSLAKKRQSVGTYPSSTLSSRTKTQQNSVMMKSTHRDSLNHTKDALNSSRDGGLMSARDREKVKQSSRQPKIHSGPFNTQCIFMDNPKSLFQKITGLLLRMNMRYHEPQAYSLQASGGPQLSIESVQGISGVHLVKFQNDHPLNQTILEVLSK